MVRVEYPLEGGYRMETQPLPNWIYLTVEEDINHSSKQLVVHSRIHMNKEVRMYPTYSNEYTDLEIIKDLSGEISRRFL